jgi:hypothetical protein
MCRPTSFPGPAGASAVGLRHPGFYLQSQASPVTKTTTKPTNGIVITRLVRALSGSVSSPKRLVLVLAAQVVALC